MIHISLRIVEIKKETSDTITLCLKQPGLKKIKYLPGQYLTLVFKIDGRKYSRPYSFSSAPDVDQHLEVTIKRTPGGVVSNYINDFLNVGDVVQAMHPMGDFIFNPEQIEKEKYIVLWAAGSGITPLISIAKYILKMETGHKVTLVYGNRDADSVIFRDKLLDLKGAYHKDFEVWHFHSQPTVADEGSDVIKGRINPRIVLSAMKHVNLTNTLHYICGPSELKNSIKLALKELLIGEQQIFSEDFEIVRNPADFEGITTQTVGIWKDGQKSEIEVSRGKTILESGLDNLIDFDYSCQTGSCLVCKAKVLSGGVRMIGVDKKPEVLQPDECLLCCSFPLTNDVIVSV